MEPGPSRPGGCAAAGERRRHLLPGSRNHLERLLYRLSTSAYVEFDSDAVRVDQIREEVEYGGLRLRTTASISGARIAVTVDVALGDALEPGAEVIDYPCMLDLPAPRLRAYARETVIAEKFQAMVAFGRANSRMKQQHRGRNKNGLRPGSLPAARERVRSGLIAPLRRWQGTPTATRQKPGHSATSGPRRCSPVMGRMSSRAANGLQRFTAAS
jgi:hypothetical protein